MICQPNCLATVTTSYLCLFVQSSVYALLAQNSRSKYIFIVFLPSQALPARRTDIQGYGGIYITTEMKLVEGTVLNTIVTPYRFEVTDISNAIICTRTQIPLTLAWAKTIHKTQGDNIPHASMSLSKCFTHGQAYTALSRMKTMAGLHLQSLDKK